MAQFRGHKASLRRFTTSPYPYSYHVFLSFRGVETRTNFTDHLYTALVNAGVRTFRDDIELERGENINEELEKAIRQSRCSVIVFSEDYTSSKWCLDELVTILHLKRTSDHVLLPVFYKVNPSQLRNKAECLAEIQENQSPEKLNAWRAALREVTGLAGMVLADRHESEFIQNIIEEIQDKLGRLPLTDIQELLQEKLLSVDPVLDDAEGKQLKFKTTVKPWLHKLKEAVFHAEDLLQEIKTEVLRQNIEREYGSSTSEVQELISTPSPAFNSALMYSRQVLERLDFIMEQRRDVLGMEASAEYKVTIRTMSTSLVEASGVCGRNDEKETLTKLLLSDDESGKKISVVPIVGMGGIGKTTLARFLYTDVGVEQHFDLRGWVCVSKEFDVFRISQHIYESLTRTPCQILSLDLLQSTLQNTLRGKRFLIVLDDIWSKNYEQLEFLMLPFQSGAHGSKIIVTTRDENVARKIGNLEAHHLRPLLEEDAWSLFKKHAFKNAGVGAHSHLEAVGRKIVQRCHGLPLAIKSLGGLLCSKVTVGEWQSILESEMWELSPDESEILPSLWMSYVDLPLHLKRCFAYCSIFPKNYILDKSQLIYLWMAGDLLQPRKNKTAEEIGQDYFNDLVSRSFFELSSIRYESDVYVMHDLINDLVNFVSGEFCFRWEGNESPNTLSKIRHCSYVAEYDFLVDVAEYDNRDSLWLFETLQQAKCLFTFLQLEPPRPWLMKQLVGNREVHSRRWLMKRLVGNREVHYLLPQLQCLRVLKLAGHNIEELPHSISNLKLLRHLDLNGSGLKKLPDTICTLCNLQVLLLRYCGITNLPANLGRLINLSHLDFRGTLLKKMPPNMGNLKELQMLPEFRLDKKTARDNLPEVKKLQNLRGSLRISGLVHSSRLGAYILVDMRFLKELVLEWGTNYLDLINGEEEREVLEKLHPHLNLEKLTIDGYGGQVFPDWSGYYFSSALVSLRLVNCVNCVSLPPLGQLPLLTELYIKGLNGVVSIGSEFYYGDSNTSASVNKPFRSLQSLELFDMSGWKEWGCVGGDNIVTFPKLTMLDILFCNRLSSWPEKMHSLFPSLESLRVKECGEMECFPEGGFPTELKNLAIEGCKKLNAKSMQNLNRGCLRALGSLETLSLNFDSDEKVEDWFAEEEEGLLPSTLIDLTIDGLNCETIEWFGHLSSLRDLWINDCLALRQLPESGLPSSLQNLYFNNCPALRCLPECGLPSSVDYLDVIGCPLLQERCARGTGEDWPKIKEIKDIRFDEFI